MECAKVLVVFPVPYPSHNILGTALAKGLAKGGMEVTYVSPFTVKDPPTNFTSLQLDGLREWQLSRMYNKEVDLFRRGKQHHICNLIEFNKFGDKFGEKLLTHPVIQNLLTSKQHFDAVILEQFLNDALKILGYHFGAPLITFSTLAANKWINGLAGNPEPASYIPDLFSTFDVNNPSFFDRLINLFSGVITQASLELIFYPSQDKLLKKFYSNATDFHLLKKNVSLFLINSHESVNQPIPFVPNMVGIGGYHVEPPKPLPEELKEYMDNAENGVIYFSIGSILLPSQMNPKIKEAIMTVLGSRKERVLWKWDEENMPNKPANIKLSKWFPQQDILAHPNCKLFITHGGLLSTIEAVYHGVPVLVMPIYSDQKPNAARAETLGFGRLLQFTSVTENNLKEVLEDLLENPKYTENVKYRSRIIHDRPVAPMDLAVYWVNYVIRHKGATHLRVAGKELPYYKYYMLDVLAVIVCVTFLGTYFLLKFAKCIIYRKEKIKQN